MRHDATLDEVNAWLSSRTELIKFAATENFIKLGKGVTVIEFHSDDATEAEMRYMVESKARTTPPADLNRDLNGLLDMYDPDKQAVVVVLLRKRPRFAMLFAWRN